MISWFLDKIVFPILGKLFPNGIQGENDPQGWKNPDQLPDERHDKGER